MRFFLILMFIGITSPIEAQEEDDNYITIHGVVRDKQSRKLLEYVNVSVPGTNIGTITNSDGEFSLKIKESITARHVEISHIGYMNSLIAINGKDLSDITVWMNPNTNLLEEIVIRAGNPRTIVEEAMKKVGDNYSPNSNLFTGFYRETAQKGRRYINISEAIIDIYKTPYKERNVERDRVQIYKGRKLLSQKANDTLIVKLLGGPNLSVYVDIVKNPDLLLEPATLPHYTFKMEESVMLNDRLHYVISFTPAAILPYALYYGKLYIDRERLSFSQAEFSLSMDDRNKATEAVLRKKPFGLRFRPLEVSFLVTYKERDGISYLSYIRNEVRFRCDWKRKLFGTNYTILSEMVVTDAKKTDTTIPYRESFRANQSLSDKVADFYDDEFWGAYNIIEPTESLQSAVNKLKKQQH
ncbi:carboxypeptidase-like regulatory domain-containing protein [Parabacteroides sp. PF5-9]|uniref:carboxypeptidase-like regulatory domain-containing protein n=1 Tax=Parabacteroides sp. PF5-9 TaxID=1742404 RepID=UPI002473A91C|nr:carboxypeptidase-like regulatory domain-containing protein [Parabacteroides sp. PF5-9]